MKIVSTVLLTALVITGCGEGDSRSKTGNSTASSSAQNRPQVLKAKVGSAEQPILGVSTNSYGVWDDVEQYIESRFKDHEKATAMRQLAIAIQNALLNSDTPEKGQESTQVWFRALECVDQKLGKARYYEGKRLTAEILNSEARSRAYALHNSNSGGLYSMENDAVCDN